MRPSKVFHHLIVVFMLLASPLWGQHRFLRAIESQHWSSLASHMDRRVEICVDDRVEILPAQRALHRLKELVQRIQPIQVQPLHSGSSQNKRSYYVIGKIKSKKGPYRVMLFVHRQGGREVIQEIRMEKM